MEEVNLAVISGKVIDPPTSRMSREGDTLVSRFRLFVKKGKKKGDIPAIIVEVDAYHGLAKRVMREIKGGTRVLVQGWLRVYKWEKVENSLYWRLGMQAESIEVIDDSIQDVTASVITDMVPKSTKKLKRLKAGAAS